MSICKGGDTIPVDLTVISGEAMTAMETLAKKHDAKATQIARFIHDDEGSSSDTAVQWHKDHALHVETAETIRQAEAELRDWKNWGVIEVMVRNPNVDSFVKEAEQRIAKAEAEIAALKQEFVIQRIEREEYKKKCDELLDERRQRQSLQAALVDRGNEIAALKGHAEAMAKPPVPAEDVAWLHDYITYAAERSVAGHQFDRAHAIVNALAGKDDK
jgi:chromosome segregation ATPase